MNVKILMSADMLGLLLPCSAFTQEQRAYAELKDRDGKSIGMATFREVSGGGVIDVDVKGLTPGLHAVHVHTIGKCEGPAFTSAGGHFNPAGKKHGMKNPEGPHAGDMNNFTVNADGSVKSTVTAPGVTLREGQPNSVFTNGGTALVIHTKGDDMMTDPAGNAGDRIACGTIG